MIEHMSLPVKNYQKAKRFYTAVLKPVGYKLNMEYGRACGYMEGGHTSFWIVQKKHVDKMHVAFRAKSKKAVQHFYDVALKMGAKDNGAPGYRSDYSPDYYAAFVLDLDGHNIEAVCFVKPAKKKKKARR